MSESFENCEVVAELVEALCQNNITPEGAAKLDELLRTNKDARRYYIRYLHVHTSLRHLGRDSGEAKRDCMEALLDRAEMETSLEDPKTPPCLPPGLLDENLVLDPPNQTIINTICQAFPTTVQEVLSSSAFFGGAIVFSLGIFVLLIVLLIPSNEVQNGPIASVAKTFDAVWSNVNDDDELKQLNVGKLLKLESGIAQVKYQNGVLVNLQGPCSFVVSGPDQGLLLQGTISALAKNVPPGFAILTPIGKVTDLGTEFGVKVAENHDTQVQTFQGLVRLEVARVGYKSLNAAMPAQSLEIRRGEAVEVDANRRVVKPIYYSPDQFTRTYEKLKPPEQPSHLSLAGNFAGVFHENPSGSSEEKTGPDAAVSGQVENKSETANSNRSTEPIRSTLLTPNEVFVADLPAPEPGTDVLVILSTKINAPQGGPGGGVGFQLRRRHMEGIVVQQNDSKQTAVTVESSHIDDPTPDQLLRFVIKRSSETEFVFYYQTSGIRTKIAGPLANPELQGADDFFAGVKLVPQETK